MNEPVVTVVMPCFNHGRYIGESISAVLNQRFQELELIVIDDASADGSVDEVLAIQRRDARVCLIRRERNCGPSRARNDGIAAARGQFLAFCDADDIWLPEKLERQVALLRSRPDCGLAYCDAQIVDANGTPTGENFSDVHLLPRAPSGDLFAALCERNFINTQSVLVRRNLLASNEWFDERIRCNEDWWLWLRLAAMTRFIYDPQVSAQYRVHPMSTGYTQPRRYKRDLWKMCKRNLRAHPEMPRNLQGLMWARMGVALYGIGKRRLGRAFVRRGLVEAIRGRAPVTRVVRMMARVIQTTFGL